MAQTNYSKQNGSSVRREGMMSRGEYLCRVYEFAPRGVDLPQTKLESVEVEEIRSAAKQRAALTTHIRANLTNTALAKKYNVHVRTIEKVLTRETWSHVA